MKLNKRATSGRAIAAFSLGALVAATFCLGLHANGRKQAADPPQNAQTRSATSPSEIERTVLDQYCVTCHNDRQKTAGLSLTGINPSHVETAPEIWEKVVQKLRTGEMPPPERPRPDKAVVDSFVAQVETALDRAAAATPNPGTPGLHRLNRSQYTNAIRDLLSVELDVASVLPSDDTVEGFDNIASALTISPLLMERYLSTARRVSRLAVGDPSIGPGFHAKRYSISSRQFQDDRMSEDLPFGSRGGLAFRHRFPLDGHYRIKILLQRQLYHFIRGLGDPHEIEIRIDGKRVKAFTVGGGDHGVPPPISYAGNYGVKEGTSPEWEKYRLETGDADIDVLVPVAAGTRMVGVAFVARNYEPEGIVQPGPTGFHFSVDESLTSASGRQEPAIDSVEVFGPYRATGSGDTVSRRQVFTCRPRSEAEETPCAKQILATVARRAFRRPVTDRDIAPLLNFYKTGLQEGSFESGIQEALARILVEPEFLFRIERAPSGTVAGSNYRLTDLQLASRLSFFLWNSIPDDELLDVASRGQLSDPAVLERQVRRMLADERSNSLVHDFVAQWLGLRNLRGIAPNPELFPETVFDETLRDALRQESELFIGSQLRGDRSVIELLTANYTFVNERLARHYGIPNVYGSRFRRVTLPDDHPRGGLLGQGSILMLTSYADRTSPVLRGKWLLDNVFGAPPPPPLPNVPALEAKNADGRPLSARAQMAQHRKNPVCASCHVRMDPLGLALENFDAIGKWRTLGEDGMPIDASGSLPDKTRIDGIAGLRKLAVSRSGDFGRTLTEKMLMYAIGRGIEYYDMPAIRHIVKDAAVSDYRWSAIILGIVKSRPFQMRRSES